MASTLTQSELLAARSAIVPPDTSDATVPTTARLVTRVDRYGAEVTALRPALAQVGPLTPEQRVGIDRALDRLSAAIAQTAAAAGLARTGRP